MDQQSFDTYRPVETAPVAPAQSLLPAILAGLGAALVGGIGWTVLTAMTGYEVAPPSTVTINHLRPLSRHACRGPFKLETAAAWR